jgi:predicted nucleic acid-binding protein
MNDKPFFDTNVILYAFSQNDARGQVAETLLAAGGSLSVQVIFSASASEAFQFLPDEPPLPFPFPFWR